MACNHSKSVVTDTRKRPEYTTRRKKCLKCGDNFSTVEVQVDLGSGRSAWDALEQRMMREWAERFLENFNAD